MGFSESHGGASCQGPSSQRQWNQAERRPVHSPSGEHAGRDPRHRLAEQKLLIRA